MSKVIPLSCLVVLVGPTGAGKSTFAKTHFPEGEVVSMDAIRQEMTGDFRRQDMNDAVAKEFYRRLRWRLDQGLRTVADATHLRAADRKHSAKIGLELGVPTFYVVIDRPLGAKNQTAGWRADVIVKGGATLVSDHNRLFQTVELDILTGDSLNVTVIDTRKDKFEVVKLLPRQPKLVLPELIRRGFNRIRVVGDVHGNMDGLYKANQSSGGTFMIYLGDVVDYGQGTLKANDYVAGQVNWGYAVDIFANHEKKILRWVQKEYNLINARSYNDAERLEGYGFGGNLSNGNAVTTNQILALSPEKRRAWEVRFLARVAASPHHIVIKDDLRTYGFVHGAFEPEMFAMEHFRLFEPYESLAFFGETVKTKGQPTIGPDGYPIRLYNWVERIPTDHVVMVGHDVRSRDVVPVITGAAGGRTIFLDTGSSKEGILSWMDYEIVEQGKKLFLREDGFGNETR